LAICTSAKYATTMHADGASLIPSPKYPIVWPRSAKRQIVEFGYFSTSQHPLDRQADRLADAAGDEFVVARQHRLIDEEVSCLDDAAVGGNEVPCTQLDQVAGDQRIDGDVDGIAVANRPCMDRNRFT
jgi:hypothetical protein